MERKIYKYPLLREPEQEMLLPADFEPLKVERVGDGFFLWGIVGPLTSPTLRTVWFVGTGWWTLAQIKGES